MISILITTLSVRFRKIGRKKPLDDELVLLLVSSGDDEVVFGADEPEELLEPEGLASLRHERSHSHFSQDLRAHSKKIIIMSNLLTACLHE
jgi:hypothetical protein